MTLKRRGFTLVELLVVISVIALLAGLTATVIVRQGHRPRATKTMGRVHQIKLAIEQFRLENNQYPWALPVDDTTSPVIVFADVAKELNPSNANLSGTVKFNLSKRDYLAFTNSGSVKEINSSGQVVDPWSNEYKIHWDTKLDRVIIWSRGPDGNDDTTNYINNGMSGSLGDDITSMK